MLAELSSGLQSISANVQAGILAFIGTVIAVIWSNAATGNRLQRQFVEERRRAETARLFESRRDVYLEAADAITVATTCIARLSDPSRTIADILKPYEDNVGNIAKVHLLAGPAVGALVVALASEVNGAIIELTVSRVPLEIVWTQAKRLEDRAAGDPTVIAQAAALRRNLLPKQMQFAEECVRRAGSLALLTGQCGFGNEDRSSCVRLRSQLPWAAQQDR